MNHIYILNDRLKEMRLQIPLGASLFDIQEHISHTNFNSPNQLFYHNGKRLYEITHYNFSMENALQIRSARKFLLLNFALFKSEHFLIPLIIEDYASKTLFNALIELASVYKNISFNMQYDFLIGENLAPINLQLSELQQNTTIMIQPLQTPVSEFSVLIHTTKQIETFRCSEDLGKIENRKILFFHLSLLLKKHPDKIALSPNFSSSFSSKQIPVFYIRKNQILTYDRLNDRIQNVSDCLPQMRIKKGLFWIFRCTHSVCAKIFVHYSGFGVFDLGRELCRCYCSSRNHETSSLIFHSFGIREAEFKYTGLQLLENHRSEIKKFPFISVQNCQLYEKSTKWDYLSIIVKELP
jgi:hypothetical protein